MEVQCVNFLLLLLTLTFPDVECAYTSFSSQRYISDQARHTFKSQAYSTSRDSSGYDNTFRVVVIPVDSVEASDLSKRRPMTWLSNSVPGTTSTVRSTTAESSSSEKIATHEENPTTLPSLVISDNVTSAPVTTDKSKENSDSDSKNASNPGGQIIEKTTTTITLEKSLTQVNESTVSDNKSSNDTDTDACGCDTDIDAFSGDKPETARKGRANDPVLKSEASTHHVELDKIEEKLGKSTMDFDALREVLGSLVGHNKAEEILPKSGDSTVLNKAKRSSNPKKLKKFKRLANERRKRATGLSYQNGSGNPEHPPQIPELLVPTGTTFEENPSVPGTDAYYPVSREIPVRSQKRFSYAVRTLPKYSDEQIVQDEPSKNYANSRQSSANLFKASPKYLNFRDLPVSQDYLEQMQERQATRIVDTPSFQTVRVTYEYLTPVSISPPQSGNSYGNMYTATQTRQQSRFDASAPEVEILQQNPSRSYASARIVAESPQSDAGYGKMYTTAAQTRQQSRFDATAPEVVILQQRPSRSYASAGTVAEEPVQSEIMDELPILMPASEPIRISYDVARVSDNARLSRYKRSSASKEISKRRVPMVLSTVSRLTRSGPF